MTRRNRQRLHDILRATDQIERHLAAELSEDALHDAICFQLLVIGEAVKHLDPETVAREPGVRWQQIAGLRDVIAHEYFRIELDRIRAIVAQGIPDLRAAVERLLDGSAGRK